MKIALTQKITEKIDNIMRQRMLSGPLNVLIANSINENEIYPEDIETLKAKATLLVKNFEKSGTQTITLDEAMLMSMIMELLGNQFGPQIMPYILSQLNREIKVFDKKEFEDNPYLKNIKFEETSFGDFEFCYQEYHPYELDIYDCPTRAKGSVIDLPKVSCFTETFKYPSFRQNSIERTWMSITPNEITTMEKPIKEAKGKVLTLGCGMGYYAYMVSLKEDVSSVTIVEYEQDVIDLFEKCILPQCEHKDKFKIIKGDAIEFLKNMEDGEYDYCFADIWLGVGDVLPYIKTKEVGRKIKKTKMSYWLEDSFAYSFSGYAYLEIMKAFCKETKMPFDEAELKGSDADENRTYEYISKLLENEEITRPEHIDYYMDVKTIMKLINETDLIY